ncbi:hypothetical protein PSI21_15065 [Xenorhabdus griffiniae]|nr:hypothetical protein [Xenorhabdus griffiniae]MDC9606280.1 hypothetical protein [Xenorhabdus griffiniae]
MPVRAAMPLLTGPYTCLNNGQMTGPDVKPLAFLTRSPLPPNPNLPNRCWNVH